MLYIIYKVYFKYRKCTTEGGWNMLNRLFGNYLVEKLSERGIYVSSMSACSSGFFNPSHVLLAIGLGEEEAKSALRITFGIDNSIDEIDELIDSLKEIVR